MRCAETAHRLATRVFRIPIAFGVAVACSALGDANASELIVLPWLKLCGDDLCIVSGGLGLSAKCPPVASAAVIERTGETKKTLRVTLWSNVHLDGVRVSIDSEQPVKCFGSGFMADCETGPELVDQLKHGTTLMIEATSASGVPLTYKLPLGGFATAYDGPAIALRVFEPAPGKLEEELRKRQEGQERPQENHKAGCEAESK
jgi:invasion protein IalB